MPRDRPRDPTTRRRVSSSSATAPLISVSGMCAPRMRSSPSEISSVPRPNDQTITTDSGSRIPKDSQSVSGKPADVELARKQRRHDEADGVPPQRWTQRLPVLHRLRGVAAGWHSVEGSLAARGERPPGSDVQVLVQRLDPGVPLPAYALPGDAGADIVAAEDLLLEPGERAVLPTGIAIACPPATPRSSTRGRVWRPAPDSDWSTHRGPSTRATAVRSRSS